MTNSTSARVVSAVAAATGVDHTALPPLYDAVDPDALDALFDQGRELPGHPIEVRFSYADVEVSVRDGVVSLAGTKVLGGAD